MKKILFLLAFSMLILAMYTNIFAGEREYNEYYNAMERKQSEDGYTYSIKEDGTVVLHWMPSDKISSEEIIIPETVDGMPVSELRYSFLSLTMTKKVIIPKTVSIIPRLSAINYIDEIIVDENNPYLVSADGVLFSRDMTKLVFYPSNKTGEEYHVPEGVKEICNYAFCYSKLKKIELPKSLEIIGESAFAFNSNLTEFRIPENVKEIKDCALHGVNVDHYNLDPQNPYLKIVNHILYSADGKKLISCPGGFDLISIVIPEGTETIYGDAFSGIKTISRVIFPDSLKEIRYGAFSFCSSLKKIDFNSKLESIGDYAFNSTGLKSCDFPDTIKEIGNMAFSDTSLNKLKLPAGLEKLGDYAFSNIDVKELFIPKTLLDIGKNAFTNLNIKTFKADPDNEKFATIEGVLFDKTKKSLICYPNMKKDTEYYIPNGIKEINSNGFQHASALTFVSIPDTVEIIGEYAFAGLSNLEQVQMPNSVTEIGSYAFKDCTLLKNINISNSLKTIRESTFLNCASLNEITIPGVVEYIFSSAFGGCKGLENITINEGVKGIYDNAFSGCGNITEISIPNTVGIIGTDAFKNCTSLQIVSIGSGLKTLGNSQVYSDGRLTNDGTSIFANCNNLEAIYVNANNEYYTSVDGVLFANDGKTLVLFPTAKYQTYYEIPEDVESISSHAFQDCQYLEEVDFPDSVTRIGDYAFEGCTIEINGLPEDLESIGTWAFTNCFGITDIFIPDSCTYIGHMAFCAGDFERIDVDPDNENYYSKDGVLFDRENQMLIAYPCKKDTRDYTIPDGIKIIDNVFFNSDNLTRISIPASVEKIVESILEGKCFENCDNLETILVKKGSYAEGWAIENGYNVEYLDEYDWLNE